MARGAEHNPNNRHYSDQSGHAERGTFNKAKKQALSKNLPLSRGELYVTKRFALKDPDSGKHKSS